MRGPPAAAAATAATNRASDRAVATEPGLGRGTRVSAAVVGGDDLDALMARETIPVLVLDTDVGETDVPVVVGEIVFARPASDLLGAPSWPAITVPSTAIALLEEPLVVALQLVVEDHATDAPALVPQALLGPSVGTIDVDVVRQLSRLPEAGVEGLARLVGALRAFVSVGFKEIPAALGQDNGSF